VTTFGKSCRGKFQIVRTGVRDGDRERRGPRYGRRADVAQAVGHIADRPEEKRSKKERYQEFAGEDRWCQQWRC